MCNRKHTCCFGLLLEAKALWVRELSLHGQQDLWVLRHTHYLFPLWACHMTSQHSMVASRVMKSWGPEGTWQLVLYTLNAV